MPDDIIACICEGSAERAIIDLLLDNNLLIFTRDDLLDEEVLSCRNAHKFEETYLRKGFKQKIKIYRILDSRRENFRLRPAYSSKVDVINVITAPEIEMLVIFNEGKYDEYKKSGLKPSEYCKQVLHYKDIKKYTFITEYFNNIDQLVEAIIEYKRISKIHRGEICLADLLRR